MKYQEDVERTEAVTDMPMTRRCADNTRLLHGAIGIATEAGELLDALKKHIYYNKELDKVNISEEIGDVLWYAALLCNCLEIDMQDVMDTNIAKLKARYPEKFDEDKAENRNLKKERRVLEDLEYNG